MRRPSPWLHLGSIAEEGTGRGELEEARGSGEASGMNTWLGRVGKLCCSDYLLLWRLQQRSEHRQD